MTGVCLFVSMLVAGGAGAVEQGVERNVDTVTTGTDHRDLYGMDMVIGSGKGMAVGGRGTLLVTADGGATWARRNLDTKLALFDVELSGNRAVVVGQTGLVRYRDANGTWQTADSGTEERLLSVDANDDGLAIAVGTFGTLLRSTDGGATWQPVDYNLAERIEGGYEPHLNDVHVADDGTITVVGEFSLVVRSTDGGDSWSIVHRDEVTLFGLQIRGDGTGYAVGQQGTVLRSEDAGATWTALDTGINANLLGVASSPDGTIVVPGMRHMIISEDSGRSWHRIEDGDVDRNWYIDAIATDEGTLAIGHTGRVIRIDKVNKKTR